MNYKTAFGIIICLLFISLVVIFCVVLIKLYIQKIKEYNLKNFDFQKTLNKTIIETQEQVFENISQDLHDDIGQQLTFVNFQLEKIKLDNESPDEDLDKLSHSIAQIAKSIRDLSHSMNNQLIVQYDLQKAMYTEVERIRKYKNMQVNFDYFATKQTLSDTEKIFVFRIFQEAIANCLKYAKATILDVRLAYMPYFKMEIIDNGVGFDVENITKIQSLGWINIRKRAEMIGFEVDLVSKINHGTHLTLTYKPQDNE